MGFHLWIFICGFSSVGFHLWIFICGFSSVSFHLWVFICGFSSVGFHSCGVCERSMRAEYASEAFFDETMIIRIFFCNAKLVYIII
jgi:hypothetical protein